MEIKYFGMLAEITGKDRETLDISGVTVAEVKKQLHRTYPELAQKGYQVAIDQELVTDDNPATGKEMALLPPFAGG